MTNAPHDQNNVKATLGVWCVDGTTLIPIAINPSTGRVKVDGVSTISFNPATIAPRDNNFQPSVLAQNSVDGTPIPIYVNASGEILIDP